MTFNVSVLVSGYCESYHKLAVKAFPWKKHQFPAAFGLLKHPSGNAILFDTGYAPRVSEGMKSFPFPLYASSLPITQSRKTAKDLLEAKGISHRDVDLIILSHFHPDHIGGLKDFPDARILCSRDAWKSVKGRQGFKALFKGYLPKLIPDDFESRLEFYEDLSISNLNGFSDTLEIRRLTFEGDDLHLASLPGHVPGQIGLIENSGEKINFFIADAVWHKRAISEGLLPHPLAMLIHDDRNAYKSTITKLHKIYLNSPSVHFIPTHHPGSK